VPHRGPVAPEPQRAALRRDGGAEAAAHGAERGTRAGVIGGGAADNDGLQV
jgi:hypothetical protein